MFASGNMILKCQACGQAHRVFYTDFPEKDSSRIDCLVEGCGGLVIEAKGTRDWQSAEIV